MGLSSPVAEILHRRDPCPCGSAHHFDRGFAAKFVAGFCREVHRRRIGTGVMRANVAPTVATDARSCASDKMKLKTVLVEISTEATESADHVQRLERVPAKAYLARRARWIAVPIKELHQNKHQSVGSDSIRTDRLQRRSVENRAAYSLTGIQISRPPLPVNGSKFTS
jgi:hypothetical protein